MRQIVGKQMKLAMSVGDSRHYDIRYIKGRHFIQTAERAGLPGALAHAALEEVAQAAAQAMETVANELPPGFPEKLHASVQRALIARLLLLG